MNANKSSLSQAQSYQAIGEHWDTHDLGEVWERTEPVEFAVEVHSEARYYPVESGLSKKLHAVAQQRGISAETLVNLWLQKMMAQEAKPL